MVEAGKPEDERLLTFWLQSDAEVDFLYKIGGLNIVTDSGRFNAPNAGTFVLHPGQADSPWRFGATLDSAGRIDVSIELHKTPKTLARKQCSALR